MSSSPRVDLRRGGRGASSCRVYWFVSLQPDGQIAHLEKPLTKILARFFILAIITLAKIQVLHLSYLCVLASCVTRFFSRLDISVHLVWIISQWRPCYSCQSYRLSRQIFITHYPYLGFIGTNVSHPLLKIQYCGELPWHRGSVFDLRQGSKFKQSTNIGST